MGSSFRPWRPLLRLLARVPTLLYRAHCGWLLGEGFLLLRHTGRKTGRKRATVLEVVAHDKLINSYYVVAGLGARSDWFQNVLMAPHVEIEVGRQRFHAIGERVPPEEATGVFWLYARRHRYAARYLELVLGLHGADKDLAEVAQRYPLVRLRTAETIGGEAVRRGEGRARTRIALAYDGTPQTAQR